MKLHANAMLLITMLPLLLWSAWKPYDRLTWWLEVAPVLLGFAAIFIAETKRWRFSTLAIVLIGLHMAVLTIGGHYTYARVPLGDWARETFNLSRNHYDRLGHLLQGFTPAILCRELFVRNRIVTKRGWLGLLAVCFCMAVSALYELLEWGAAMVSAEAAESFLGTQGDHWDTQSDMFCALIGATAAVFLLRKAHNRSMQRCEAVTRTPD